jgi:hypothetical protein
MPGASLEKPWMPTSVGMTTTVGRIVTVNAGWYKFGGMTKYPPLSLRGRGVRPAPLPGTDPP